MHELVLRVPEALVEPVSDALTDELRALAVSVEDADADAPGERALFGEPGLPPPGAGWACSTLKALFDTEAAATEAAMLLLAQDWPSVARDVDGEATGEAAEATGEATGEGAADAEVHLVSLAPVPDEDWVRLTQSQFEPVEIAPEFWIVPTWHDPPSPTARVIRLDPGLAFGTGTHPTTAMCLAWIAAHHADLAGARVLDYGCGSGILSIGAALHGAAAIDAVDIDPAALVATAQNARANGVVVRAGAPETAAGQYRAVLANILAMPLKLLAPLLCARVAPGGHLVLAGILERQAEDLRAAYAPWMAIDVEQARDGWILMTGRRPAA
jgi:ribosomal protein L11 methyltransferase